MKTKITKEFIENRNRLKYLFPSAFDFLTGIEENPQYGFWLSTSRNAHLYYLDAFYFYLKLEIGIISISPNFNGRIESSAKNNSKLLFLKPIKDLIIANDGLNNWAKIVGMSDLELNNKTPIEFFEKLLQLIQKIHK
jgi:hypothetical protein